MYVCRYYWTTEIASNKHHGIVREGGQKRLHPLSKFNRQVVPNCCPNPHPESLLQTSGIRAMFPCRRAADSPQPSIGSINAHAPTFAFASSTLLCASRGNLATTCFLIDYLWVFALVQPVSTSLDKLSKLPIDALERGMSHIVHKIEDGGGWTKS